jgi:hypothetical protein
MTDDELLQAVAEWLGAKPESLDRKILATIDRQVQQLRQCDGLVADRVELVARRYVGRIVVSIY